MTGSGRLVCLAPMATGAEPDNSVIKVAPSTWGRMVTRGLAEKRGSSAQVIGTSDDSARMRDVEILPNVSQKVSKGVVVSRESLPLPL